LASWPRRFPSDFSDTDDVIAIDAQIGAVVVTGGRAGNQRDQGSDFFDAFRI
jgi:hypothetical protein